MYSLELIKFDVSNTSYYVEVEIGALLHDVAQSWKTIFGGDGKVMENFLGKKHGNPVADSIVPARANAIATALPQLLSMWPFLQFLRYSCYPHYCIAL